MSTYCQVNGLASEAPNQISGIFPSEWIFAVIVVNNSASRVNIYSFCIIFFITNVMTEKFYKLKLKIKNKYINPSHRFMERRWCCFFK
jgi:hypothetical protein